MLRGWKDSSTGLCQQLEEDGEIVFKDSELSSERREVVFLFFGPLVAEEYQICPYEISGSKKSRTKCWC